MRQGRALALLLGVLVAFLSVLFSATASAATIEWSFPLESPHIAFIELRHSDETLIDRFRTTDEKHWNRFGWRADEDKEMGWVKGRLDPVSLPPGTYFVDLVLPEKVHRQELVVEGSAGAKEITVLLPEGSKGIRAWSFKKDFGNTGLAWWPVVEGKTPPVALADGEWMIYADGQATLPARYNGTQDEVSVVPVKLPEGGFEVEQETKILRFVLLPLSLAFLGAAAWALYRLRRTRGLLVAVMASLAVSIGLCHQILGNLAGHVPCRFPNNYRDPFDSVFFLSSFQDSILGLSDVTHSFSYPDGASWLGTGPALLGYILPGLLANFTGPVVANNIAVVGAMAALCFCVWLLSRAVGAGPYTALLGGFAVVLSPVVMAEIDKASLDRLMLFPIPVFFLSFLMAAERKGWKWPVAAGVSLAAIFYFQIYYGLYLAAACPVLVLSRLTGTDFQGRLRRMLIVGAVALALLLPGLMTLRTVTAGSGYDTQSLGILRGDTPIWPPISEEEAQSFFQSHDIRLVVDPNLQDVSRQPDLPMDSPVNRMLSAATTGLFLEDFVTPVNHLPGDELFWVLIFVSLLLAKRRRLALILTLDIAILMAYSLGPMVRTREEVVMTPLPYYLNVLFIPGFDQLKNIYRYRLMAATLCGVPLALGLEGLFRRLKAIYVPRFRLVEMGVAAYAAYYLLSGSFQWPKAYAFPHSTVVDTLDSEPSLVLPIEATLDDPASLIQLMQLGIPLVNEMPLEPLHKASGSAKWFEHIGLLNHIAYVAGSRRPNRWVPLLDIDEDMKWVEKQDIRYIILYRRLMVGPELVGESTASLDALFERVGADGHVVVWDLEKPLWRQQRAAQAHEVEPLNPEANTLHSQGGG